MQHAITEERATELIKACQVEATQAIQEGNPPFACILTDADGTILITAHNQQNTDYDPTAHAEILALRRLGAERQTRYLQDCILFSNAESCTMCIAAAIKAHVSVFFFGAPSEGSMNPQLTVADVAAKTKTPLEIHTGILAESCATQIAQGRATTA
jgi:tRNA(adenine34) deaminase